MEKFLVKISPKDSIMKKFYNKKINLFSNIILSCILGFSQIVLGQSFHDTKGSIDVTSSGQLQYTVPIALPPGIKDTAPNLDMTYLSGSGNGIAGFGWSISGITTITRTGRTIDKDGELKGIQLDYSDYYSFNGQRLILKSGEYGKNGAEYVTEKYSNAKIKSLGSITGLPWQGPEYWEITFEDGSQAWYGGVSSGNSTARSPIEYNIVKWRDKKGNYISYNYTQSGNISLLSNIQWGGNEELGKTHFNQVNFFYGLRNVKESSYIKGVSLIQDKRLSQVTVLSNNQLFKNYSIQYSTTQNIINNDPNNKINYDFVEKVIETNSAGEDANPVTFSTKPLATSTSESNFGDFNNIVTTGDYNGDGLVDFIVMQPAQNGRPEGYYIYFDAINSSSPSFVYLGSSSTYWPSSSLTTFNIKSADNFVKTKQGLVISKGNVGTNPPNTGNIELKYYSIKSDASVLNTYNNPLVLEYSKTISSGGYVYDPSIYPAVPDPTYNYNGIVEKSGLHLLKEVDIDSDGMSELIMGIQDSKCFNRVIVEDPLKTTWLCNTLGYRYIVVDNDDIQNNTVHIIPGTTPKNILGKGGIMDFDNDGKQDVIFIDPTGTNTNATFYTKSYINGSVGSKTSGTPVNNLMQYELKKQNNNYTIELKKNHTVKGLADGIQFGDLNGDKNIEVLLPLHEYKVNDEYTPGWSIYLNTGINLEESLQGLMLYKKDIVSRPDIISTTSIIDLDNDGKGEIVNSFTFFSDMNTNLNVNWRLDSYSEPYYNPYDSQFKWRFNEKRLMSSERPKSVVSPLFGDFRVNNSSSKVLFLLKSTTASNERKLVSYQHYNLNSDKNVSSISQANLQYDIDYKELDPAINANIYAPVKKEQYPYVEMDRLSQTFAVSQIRMAGRKQDFRYRGYIANLHGKGVIGYRQTARSSWYADGFENTKIWSGVEIDPLNDGLPVKEWSIRTNNENQVFPADISENNTQLLSFKSTLYQTDKLLNGQVVTIVTSSDKPKIVTAIIPKSNKKKDFLTGTVTESSITYGDYYLPTQSVANTNSGYGIVTSTYEYTHNPSGVGADYYIGRLKTKTDQTSAYGDTQSAKEEYAYENNLLKTLKTWNRDNTGFLLETYGYDGFGNITQKVVSNSIDAQTQTETSLYEPKGRFVIKKTDNLGLETNITYNNRGQILTQTDPLGNSLTNTYDDWGKLLSTNTSLGGTTTYQYEKDFFSNKIVTQNDPDGDISKKYINTLAQEYMVSTKSFNQGYFVLKANQYDVLGRKIKESEPFYEGQGVDFWNTITYDDSVFPAKVVAASFNGKQMETAVSGLTTTVKELNGYGRTTSKTVDVLGNVVSSTDKGGTITFAYNAAGEQIKAQYGENIVTTKYDSWGRKSEFNDPSNGLYKYEYDGFGQPKKTTSPKGTKEYTYNNLGQLITQKELSTIDGGQTTNKLITFTYDTKGRLTSKSGTIKGQLFSSNITYDSQGRLSSSSEISYDRTYTQKGIVYDNKSRVISYEKELQSAGVTTKAQIENVYSAWNGELYQVKDKVTGRILWELKETNAKSQVLKAKLGTADINNSYDTNGFLASVNHSSAVKPNILQLSYSFDAIKNELKSRTTGGDFNITESFDYDDNNRLVNWTNPITGIKPSLNRNVYDVKGRIMENDQVGIMKFENSAKIYQPTGMTLNAAGIQNYSNDLIQSIVYNENNDPVQINGEKARISFDYGLSSMRQMVTIAKLKQTGGGGSSEFKTAGVWDPDAPLWQNTKTKIYSEDGSFEVVRDQATNQEKHILYIGGSPYESNIIYVKDYNESNGSYKFLHKDYIGSILAISDEAGNKVEQRHFDAWGNFTHLKIGNAPVITDKALIAETTLLIDRGYTSHEHFMEIGIIHMNGRLYDPLLRRFLNADENIQDTYNTQNYNKYGYVLNNPLMFNDPTGEFAFAAFIPIILGALKGVIIGGLIYTAMAVVTGNASKAGFLKTVLTSFITGGIGSGVGALNVFGNGFWGTVAQGAALGAAGGAVDAVVNQRNVLQGILKGAVIGGAVAGVSWVVAKTVAYYRAKTPNAITSTELKNVGYDVSDNTTGDYYTNDQQIQNDFNRTTGDYQTSVDNVNTEYKLATDQNLPQGTKLTHPWKQIWTDNPKESGHILGITMNRNKNWWEFLVKGEKTTVLIAPNLGIQNDLVKQAVFGHEYIHAYHRYIGLMSQYGSKYSNYTESSAYHFTINLLKAHGQDFSAFLNQFYNYGAMFPGPFNWTYAIKNIVNFRK